MTLACSASGAKNAHPGRWAGHLPSLERPDRLNPLLLDFLRQ